MPGGAPGTIVQALGARAEQVHVSGRLVLKIIDVVPESPAGKAGIEPGDAIIGVNGGFFTDLDQLAAIVRKGGPIAKLTVLDVRSGQQAAVKLDVTEWLTADSSRHAPTPAPTPAPAPAPVPAPAPARVRSLRVKTESVRVGLRTTAVRVTEVQEDSPAAMAGLEARGCDPGGRRGPRL